MNNTKTIFKSLLIMIVAISLFTVSCSKDEGGTKTPTNPAQPITITAKNITAAFKGLAKITIGKTEIDFTKDANYTGNAITITGTANASATGGIEEKAALETKIKAGLKVSGATVDAKVTTTSFPQATDNTAIDITITITPASGNSFAAAEEQLTPYTKTGENVVVTLKLSPESGKKWDGK